MCVYVLKAWYEIHEPVMGAWLEDTGYGRKRSLLSVDFPGHSLMVIIYYNRQIVKVHES